MFHRHASHHSALPPPARVLPPTGYGRDAERERSFAASRAGGPVLGRVVRAGRGPCDVAAEITELAGDCRFAGCAHTAEPGCAVLSAVEDGRLAGRRLDSCHRLLHENAHDASRTGARLRAEMNRQDRQGARLRRAIKRSPNFKA